MSFQKYLVELVGTFFLVATIGFCTINPGGAGALAPLAIGSVLMVMVYAGCHISGAHYNPAVTLAVFMRGKCSTVDIVPFMVAQVVGAAAAAQMVLFLKNYPPVPMAGTLDIARALLAEFLYTFALCYVVLNVATARGTSGNSFYGLAIGFTVLAGAYSVGPISGGVFNPAVAVGITILGQSPLGSIWVYFVSGVAAAAAASAVFRFANGIESAS